MSDRCIVLVPKDPHFVPDETTHARAHERLAEFCPQAELVEIQVSPTVELFDCGQNLQQILCPSCGAEISVDWWQDQMDKDYDDGFKLEQYAMPCCSSQNSLHQLVYEWPQTFGRFALSAMNPKIELLDDPQTRELEEILGTRLVVINQHI